MFYIGASHGSFWTNQLFSF
jgi:hypothetical protein